MKPEHTAPVNQAINGCKVTQSFICFTLNLNTMFDLLPYNVLTSEVLTPDAFEAFHHGSFFNKAVFCLD